MYTLLSSIDYKRESLYFTYLPDFARFILQQCLKQFVQALHSYSIELDLPMLKIFEALPEKEKIVYATRSAREFLESIAGNNAREQLDRSITRWKKDQLPFISQNQVILDDLLLISAIRKKAFLHVLKKYTSDIQQWHRIIEELDIFFLHYDRATTNAFVQFLKDRIKEETLIKDKISNTSPGFYYIYDLRSDKQILTSEKLFDFLGYQKEDYRGDPGFFRKILHPDDKAEAEQYINRLQYLEENEVSFFEYRLLEKNGSYKWMRNYESVFKRDADDHPVQLIGVAFDNDKEHFFTEELQRREEELLEAQELAQMGSYIWDLVNKVAKNTPQMIKILGLKENEKFDDVLQKIHPSDKPKVIDSFNKALKGESDYDCEYRCTVDGKEKIIWSRGKVKFENNRPIIMKGTVMDVTDKHHMVKRLQRSEELFKQAQALNKIGNWSWEITTDTLKWSDELFRIYGLRPQSEKLSLTRFLSFIHPEDKEGRLTQLQEQMTHPSHKDYYFRIIAGDNKEKILHGQSEVLIDEHGVPYKIIGTCQDVTAQKELENSLYKKTIQLEKSNETLQQFAYLCSHDLKEPLRKISVLSDRLRLLNKDNLNDESKELLNKVMNASIRLQKMVDDILDVSRISADHSFQKVNLQKIIEEVIQALEPGLYGASIQYDPLPDVFVNETQLKQLFLNLFANAIKFRKPGVTPHVQITHDIPEPGELMQLGLDTAKKFVRILVQDNGIGFENEYAEKIFGIFQRLHDRSAYEGTGIGLTICKRILENHEGLIYAKGEPGQGATFIILLPA